MNNFQREGATSNSHAGRAFEELVEAYFTNAGLAVYRDVSLEIGCNNKRKPRKWDLGSSEGKIIIECKSHTWTKTGNVPSAKLTTWDQAMYFMHLAPISYRKIFACLRNERPYKSESLAEYYVRLKSHLVPSDVEIWEFCEKSGNVKLLNPSD